MQDYLRHLSKIRLDYTVFYLSRSGVEFLGGGGVGGGGQGRGLPLCFSCLIFFFLFEQWTKEKKMGEGRGTGRMGRDQFFGTRPRPRN